MCLKATYRLGKHCDLVFFIKNDIASQLTVQTLGKPSQEFVCVWFTFATHQSFTARGCKGTYCPPNSLWLFQKKQAVRKLCCKAVGFVNQSVYPFTTFTTGQLQVRMEKRAPISNFVYFQYKPNPNYCVFVCCSKRQSSGEVLNNCLFFTRNGVSCVRVQMFRLNGAKRKFHNQSASASELFVSLFMWYITPTYYKLVRIRIAGIM